MLQGGEARRAEAAAQGAVASRAHAWAHSAGSAGSRRAPQGSSGACRADATSEPTLLQVRKGPGRLPLILASSVLTASARWLS